MLKIDRIISVSSEDPSWPAENLLKDEGKNKKWKCKSAGEKNATVVLQLEKASKIKAIDVGNENSAFIEILVGKSCLPDDDYKVLLVASSLMTLKEAKDSINCNSVKFFKESNFCKPECNEKWDRVKVVCSQPYNKHVQFGLSFIKLHSEDDSTQSAGCSKDNKVTSGLGRFLFKQDDNEDIAIGSIFARRKELQQEDKTSAVAIRTATKQLYNSNDESVKTPTSQKKRFSKPKGSPSRDYGGDIAIVNSTHNSAKKAENNKRIKPESDPIDIPQTKKPKTSLTTNYDAGPSRINQHAMSRPVTTLRKRKSCKPFNELMRGVVFTISGFQNPLRSDIRSKALAMGAKYRPDWDNTCTHLVCAFTNTPKFNQVKGHGKIIKKDWIEESYSQRKRFPWRRFALDPSDTKRPESEEEIFEEIDEPEEEDEPVIPNGRVIRADRPQPTGPSLFGNVTIATHTQNRNKDRNKPEPKKASSKTSPKPSPAKKSPQKGHLIKADNSSNDAGSALHLDIDLEEVDGSVNDHLADTDSDHDWNDRVESDTVSDFPYLPEQFNDLYFYVADDFPPSTRTDLKRYIIAHSGTVLEKCNQDTEYVIADKSSTVEKLKERCPEVVGVKAEWVWRCHDENRLLPTSSFEL